MSAFQNQQIEEAEQLARRMRALKWVVLVLGVLLVLAMIITVVGVIYKARHSASASGNPASGNPGSGNNAAAGMSNLAPAGFGAASLKLPAACQIATTSVSGDRLIIVTSGPADICRLILVADLKTGKLIGQFGFQAP